MIATDTILFIAICKLMEEDPLVCHRAASKGFFQKRVKPGQPPDALKWKRHLQSEAHRVSVRNSIHSPVACSNPVALTEFRLGIRNYNNQTPHTIVDTADIDVDAMQ